VRSFGKQFEEQQSLLAEQPTPDARQRAVALASSSPIAAAIAPSDAPARAFNTPRRDRPEPNARVNASNRSLSIGVLLVAAGQGQSPSGHVARRLRPAARPDKGPFAELRLRCIDYRATGAFVKEEHSPVHTYLAPQPGRMKEMMEPQPRPRGILTAVFVECRRTARGWRDWFVRY
jgi:hypothetical protein